MSELPPNLSDDAAAWVLGALPDEEASAFADRLEVDPELRAEVDRLRPMADALALAAPAAEPSPQLAPRIMDVVRREAQLLAAAEAGPDRPAAAEPRRGWLRRIASRRLTVALTGAALAAGVAVGIIVSTGGSSSTTQPITALANSGVQGRVVQDDGHAVLRLDAPSPPAGKVYQAWVARDGKIQPDALITVDRTGHGSAALDHDLSGAQKLLVSVEPMGGSAQPTSAPVADMALS